MRPITFTTTGLATADTDSIALSQAKAAPGNLTINGVLASGGVATLTSSSAKPRYGLLVTIKSGGDDTGVVFTITGTRAGGGAQTEAVTGVNAGTATSTLAFETVTQIAVSAAVATVVEVGTAQAGSTDWIPMDIYTPNAQTAISVNISGSLNYSVVYTNEDPFDRSITQLAKAHPDAALTAASADQTAQATAIMRAIKFLVNSGSGTAFVNIVQQSTQ